MAEKTTSDDLRDELADCLRSRLRADELGDGVLAATVAFLKAFPPGMSGENTIRAKESSELLDRYRNIAGQKPRLIKG